MKSLFINYSMDKIKKENKYDETKLQEIKYGLEAIYLNVSKLIVYFLINYYLGILKESIIFFLLYIPLRSFSFGFHAKTSRTCWILSGIAFVGLPLVGTIINFNITLKIIVVIYSLIVYTKYSPADTPSRPIINKKYRLKLKVLTLMVVLIYSIILIFNNSLIINLMILALIHQSVLISPYFYKLFDLKYNNYLNYGLN